MKTVLFVLFACMAAALTSEATAQSPSPRFRPDGRDAEAYGRRDGYPACSKNDYVFNQRCRVGAFSHFDMLFPTNTIAAPKVPSRLARAPTEPTIRYTYQGQSSTLDEYLERQPITGFLIAKGDTILLERYQYARTDKDRLTSFSMAKTITALLVGIAVKEGAIRSINDLAETYVPELQGTEYGRTSIKALLQMSSGVAFKEESRNPADPNSDSSTLYRATLGGERGGITAGLKHFNTRAAPPGQRWNYSSAETAVLGLVVAAATRRNMSDYASEKLWVPLGAEADAKWSLDATGHEVAYAYFNATLRDWGRLGLMLAHDGKWNDKTIVPKEWLLAATTIAPSDTHLRFSNSYWAGYGYQTWLISGNNRMFALQGLRGQFVMVDPETKLVFVQTAARPADDQPADKELLAIFQDASSQLRAPALASDNGIDDLSANQLINAKGRIEECRGLQNATANPGSSVGDCVQFFMRKGDLAEYRNDLESAVIFFGEAIRLNNRPSYTEAYDRRGNALIGQGRLKEAIADFDTAISREPSDNRAFGYRGKAYFLNNENERALADLDRAIALDKANAAALVTRGELFRRVGASEKARADFEAAANLPWKDRERRIAQETAKRRLAVLGPPPRPEIAKAKEAPTAHPVKPTNLRRVALVVGNSDYRNVPILPNPQRDATAVADVLRKIGFDSVTLMTNLSRNQMSSALQDFVKLAESSDWAVVYFTGHGMEVGGVNYLVPIDAKIVSDRDIGFEAIPLEQVLNVAERAKKLRLIILDSCRDNPFFNQMKRTQSIANRSVVRGLVAVEPDAGTLVVYAAKDGETASDGDGANSPFTTAFIKSVQTPGLEVRRLFDVVRDDVMDATQWRQKPFSYGSISGRQDFYFVAAK